MDIMQNEKHPAAARVSAACALLDRGYGRPSQAMELTGKDSGPVQFEKITSDMDPAEAAALYKTFMSAGG